MSRRDRQRAELQQLCQTGHVARAVDLAFAHFADFGRDEEILVILVEALDRACPTAAVRRRLAELRDPELGSVRAAISRTLGKPHPSNHEVIEQ